MAKIVTEFDTQTKTYTVTIDGQAVADVTEVSTFRWDDEGHYRMCMTTATEDREQKTYRMNRLCASDSPEAVAAGERAVPAADVPGYVRVTAAAEPDVGADINTYLSGE